MMNRMTSTHKLIADMFELNKRHFEETGKAIKQIRFHTDKRKVKAGNLELEGFTADFIYSDVIPEQLATPKQ